VAWRRPCHNGTDRLRGESRTSRATPNATSIRVRLRRLDPARGAHHGIAVPPTNRVVVAKKAEHLLDQRGSDDVVAAQRSADVEVDQPCFSQSSHVLGKVRLDDRDQRIDVLDALGAIAQRAENRQAYRVCHGAQQACLIIPRGFRLEILHACTTLLGTTGSITANRRNVVYANVI